MVIYVLFNTYLKNSTHFARQIEYRRHKEKEGVTLPAMKLNIIIN